jgi:hypothetical protein
MKVGQIVKINYARRGKFSMKITKINGSQLKGTITDGMAWYLSGDDRVKGDKITIDTKKSFISVTK